VDDQAKSPPEILNGRYVLTEAVRTGAQATVTQAFDLERKAPVAVKRVKFGPDDARARAGFEREAASLQALTHPNIVQLIDVNCDSDGKWFLVLEWVDRTLEDVVCEDGPMSWPIFWGTIGEPLLDAICFAQNRPKPVAHRDIKPRNILVTEGGVAKLADYGIAKLIDDGDPWARVSGHTFRFDHTPGYTPAKPEEDLVLTRDCYGFAAVALSCLTGRIFKNEDDLWTALEEAVLPETVRTVLASCICDDPKQRPRIASLLRERLEQASAAEERRTEQAAELFLQLNPKTKAALEHRLDTDDLAIVERFLCEEFDEPCGIVPKPKKGSEPQTVELIGATYRFEAMVAGREGELLHILQASEIGSGLASDLRESALVRQAHVRFSRPADPKRAGQHLALLLAEARALLDRVAQERSARATERIFRVWRSYLKDRADLEAKRSNAIKYIDKSVSGDRIVFTTEIAQSDEIVGQERIVVHATGKVGGRISAVAFNLITMDVIFGNPASVPRRGEISINTAAAQRALTNQTRALDALVFGRAVSDRLKPIVLTPQSAVAPVPAGDVSPTDPEFDAEKLRVLRKALGVQDILAIEGPPGTGKTKLIAEIIVQRLARNPGDRILLSSQTHIALDNVIERVVELAAGIDIIRIGRIDDDRISEDSQKLLLERRVEAWISQVRAASEAEMKRWAQDQGVDRETVALGMKVERLLQLIRRQEETEEEIQQLQGEKTEVQAELSEGDPTVDSREADEEETQLESDIGELRRRLKKLRSDEADLREHMSAMGEYASGLATSTDPRELADWAAHLLEADELVSKCRERLALLEEWHLRVGRSPDFNAAMLSAAQVIAGTCVGVAGVRGMDDVAYDLCIIDEASKATATEILIPMVRSRRWIVVGDPKQLPPFFEELGEDLLAAFDDKEIKATMLDRLLDEDRGLPDACRELLTHQYRMIRPIGDLVSECFYNGDLESPVESHGLNLSLALPAPVTWYSTHGLPHCHERPDGETFYNPAEVAVIRELLRKLQFVVRAQKRRISVAVIAGYTAQVSALRDVISQGIAEWPDLDVDCNSVDAFQGRQADVCIYSVVRSNARASLGFLKERPRLNVALSRGKSALVIVGDQMFCRDVQSANPFRRVVEYIDMNEATCTTVELPQ
jgi:hypothetical protein